MNLYLKLRVIIPTFLILSSISCKKSELEDLKDAQICLNTAPASQARACVSGLSGDNSELANALKCSAVFISEGFGTPESLPLDLVNGSTGCGGSCSPTVNALLVLNFDSGDLTDANVRTSNINTAREAAGYCAASGVKVYSLIGSLFQIGTDAKMAAADPAKGNLGNTPPTAVQLEAAIGTLNPTTLGNLVLITHSTSCNGTPESQSDSTVKFCTELSTAIGAYTAPADIGACLKLKLDNPAAACL